MRLLLLLSLSLCLFSQSPEYEYKFFYDGSSPESFSETRTRLEHPLVCQNLCECPVNKDSWLTFSANPGLEGTSCEDRCEITYMLNIPSQFDCFTEFVVVEDGTESDPINYSPGAILNKLPECLPSNHKSVISLKLYRFTGDPNPCVITKEVGCDVDCCEEIDITFKALEQENGICRFIPEVYSEAKGLCDPARPGNDNIEINYYTFNSNSSEWIASNYDPYDQNSFIEIPDCEVMQISYMVIVDGIECVGGMVTKEVECGACDCPNENIRKSWLQLELIEDDPSCPDGCKINAKLDFGDSGYEDCYDLIDLNILFFDNDGNQTSNMQMGGNFIDGKVTTFPALSGLCLAKGEQVQIFGTLRKFGKTKQCDISSQKEGCKKIDRDNSNICTLDDVIEESQGKGSTEFYMNGCKYIVGYVFSKSEDGYQNVQVTDILFKECSNGDSESEIYKKAVLNAIFDIINNKENYLPQKNSEIPCFDFWRAIKKSCKMRFIIQEGNTIINYDIDCDSECCGSRLRACWSNGKLVVKDLGFAFGSSNYNCSQDSQIPDQSEWPTGTIVNQSSNCYDLDCDIFRDWEDDVDVFSFDDDMDHDLDPSDNQKRLFEEGMKISYSDLEFLHQKDQLLIKNLSDRNNLRFDIYTLVGKLVKSKNFEASTGEKSIKTVDISNGTYFLVIYSNNTPIGSTQINILR